jgi:hypothetical protein
MMTQDTHTVEQVALAIHEARFASPKHPRTPEPMDATDEEYCLRLARAAIEALPARTDDPLGKWMSAALDDPNVCEAMKADIREWFSAGSPPPPARPDEQVDRILSAYERGEMDAAGTIEDLVEHINAARTDERALKLVEALRGVRSMLAGYAGQPNHMGDIYKVVDAALADVQPAGEGR